MTSIKESEEIRADPLNDISEAIIEAAKEECAQHSPYLQMPTDGVTGEVRCYYAGLSITMVAKRAARKIAAQQQQPPTSDHQS